MKFEIDHFKTRVAQRIVVLFFVCALLPATTLAVIAYAQVRAELQEQRDRRLTDGIRAAQQGMTERLQSVEAELELLARQIGQGNVEVEAGALRRLATLLIVTPEESVPLAGELVEPPPVRPDTVGGLSSNKALLAARPASGQDQAEVLLAIPLDRQRPERGLLWGRALVDSLFSTATIYATNLDPLTVRDQADVGFCVFSADWLPITCTGALRSWGNGGPPVSIPADVTRGSFAWSEGGVTFSGRYRRAGMRGQFVTDDWTLLAVESDRLALEPLAEFRQTFFQGILLTLLVVLLLSVVQVRRSMEPLAQLKKGTQGIAAKDFETRVRIASGDEFEDLANSFNTMAAQVGGLVEELEALNWSTITTLARTIDAKSPWTAGHSERVARMSLSIAQVMGLSQEELDTIHRGGLLHDIGKIGVPIHILDKPTALDEEELRIMRDHVTVGARILEPLKPLSSVIPIVLYHHERYDGSGYPKGLKGEEIHLMARITAIADAFDAMQSDRPYRAGRSGRQSAHVIATASGTEFDPRVVDAFMEVMTLEDKAPAGWETQRVQRTVAGGG